MVQNFSKNLIHIIPTINDVTIPIITSFVKVRSVTFNTAAPAIIGTDNKNVNFVIASLLNPINLPARIVVPLLEKPGNTAKAWEHPIRNDCFKVISSKSISLSL